MSKRFEQICESENFVVEYNEDMNIYRVSYFEDNHFVDEIFFDGVDQHPDVVIKNSPEKVLRKKLWYNICVRLRKE